MRIISNNIAVLECPDVLSRIVEARGTLESDDGPCRENLRWIKPGDWVVDGGAAFGDHTSAYLKAVGPSGKVIAFEPNPMYFECLRHNCPSAESYMAALSNKSGKGQLWVNTGDNIGYSVVSDTGSIPIDLMQLDDLHLPRLDLLKLDIEGYELYALLGATETICRCCPIIQVEWNVGPMRAFLKSPQMLLDWFTLADYRWELFMGNLEVEGEIIAHPIKKCE